MAHKCHSGFTAAEKTELWDRWQRGESLKAIGRAFGKQASGPFSLMAGLVGWGGRNRTSICWNQNPLHPYLAAQPATILLRIGWHSGPIRALLWRLGAA